MPGLDGLQATRTIANDPALAAVRILILTTFDLDEYVFEALRSGASGFLVKDTEPQDLLTAVRVVARTRDPHARGSGSLQPRDRRRARCQPLHRRDPRQPRNAQARRPRPRPTRRLRLRIRTRPPRLENLNQQPTTRAGPASTGSTKRAVAEEARWPASCWCIWAARSGGDQPRTSDPPCDTSAAAGVCAAA